MMIHDERRMSAQGLHHIKVRWISRQTLTPYPLHTLCFVVTYSWNEEWDYLSKKTFTAADWLLQTREFPSPDLQSLIVSRSPSVVTSLGRAPGNVTNVASEAGHVSRDGVSSRNAERWAGGVVTRGLSFPWFTQSRPGSENTNADAEWSLATVCCNRWTTFSSQEDPFLTKVKYFHHPIFFLMFGYKQQQISRHWVLFLSTAPLMMVWLLMARYW